jgi:DNA repair protein SbcD/Mre11
MTKFLFYTDLHLAGETPRHRIDNFPQALVAKQREIYQIAEEEGCEFVAFGGDWFNSHRIFSYDVMSDSMDIVCGSKLKTYMTIGEHDLYGHNIDTFKSSTLAFYIKRCGMIEVLWEPTEVSGVVLYGKHETDKMMEAIAWPKDSSKVNVMLCHELITCNQAPFEMINTNTLRNSGWDLILSGDLHDGYPTHEVDGTWFCNPGSLARRSTADASRMPQVAIVSIEKGKVPNIELRKLKCGRVGTEVFGFSLAEEIKAEEADASGFTTELLKFEAESTDIHELVQKSGAKAGLSKKVLEYLETKRNVVAS